MTLVLTHSDVIRLLRRDDVFDAIEKAHAALALGSAIAPAPVAMTVGDATFIAMSAAAESAQLAGVKMLADMPANAARGLSVQRSSIMLTSMRDGSCEALIDGRHITGVRTAAVSAVATKHLARPGSTVLGLVGAGALAVEHTRAIHSVLPISTVLVWSRSTETVEAYRATVADMDLTVQAASSPEEVTRSVDVLCTLTPSREPIVRGAWFGAGLHVNAVGAPPRPDHREIDGEGLRRARLVVDSLTTAYAKSGEVLLALKEEAITEDDVTTELGAVIAGLKPGRETDADITLFNSVGVGLQDVVTGRIVLDRARETGIGIEVDLRA